MYVGFACVSRSRPGFVLTDSSWQSPRVGCRKCIYLKPKVQKYAGKKSNVLFASVDVNAVAGVPQRVGIERMPTLLLFRGGLKVDSLIGGENGVRRTKT